jgi:hypothetical protein
LRFRDGAGSRFGGATGDRRLRGGRYEDRLLQEATAACALSLTGHEDFPFQDTYCIRTAFPAEAGTKCACVPAAGDMGGARARCGVEMLRTVTLSAIAVGRPFLFGLAVDGADSVAGVINMLWNELEMALISTGRQSTANLDKSAMLPVAPSFFSS